MVNTPEHLFGELFHDVQRSRVYPDSKTFVDLVPRQRARAIQKEYALLKNDPHFSLQEFLARHFQPLSLSPVVKRARAPSAQEHVRQLWPHLQRHHVKASGTLIPLPHPYIVPGGRFEEQYYWDSYFVMLGLAAEGQWRIIEGMVQNTAVLIRRYGFVPTANRTYYLSRSQPPVFALMVQLLAEHKGKGVLRKYVPELLREYRFWMSGKRMLKKTPHNSFRRVLQLDKSLFMNRYYDNAVTARPESLAEDQTTAERAASRSPERIYLHLRAAAESGWDFSGRWCLDPADLSTIHTADIVPVDLNSLLCMLEETIADAYRAMRQPLLEQAYRKKAAKRAATIRSLMWHDADGWFYDFNFHRHEQTGYQCLAGVFPLFAGIATQEEAAAVAKNIKKQFLKPGGVLTSLTETGQQWDAPNGWAPLQWVAVVGLRKYGFHQLATDITKRFTRLVEETYDKEGRIVEKYNVTSKGLGGGGEYVLQDGFGWTNGVYAALKQYLS